jgi:hypothetical protein
VRTLLPNVGPDLAGIMQASTSMDSPRVSLHFNKGLAGAPAATLQASRDTATNPAALDASALLISAAEGPSADPGIANHEPDVATVRRQAKAIDPASFDAAKQNTARMIFHCPSRGRQPTTER